MTKPDIITAQVLADAAKYVPGAVLPPHLSPFVTEDGADDEEHIPDYALELRRLQVRSNTACLTILCLECATPEAVQVV